MSANTSSSAVEQELLAAAKIAGLTADELALATKHLGRTPNVLEIGLFGAMWSEHCSYKSSRIHLRRLPSKGPRVLIGPGENAGVVDVGDGLAVAFKMESHNHPSYLEPFQGAATGVGGMLRDVFTMGARPIAVMDALRFGSPKHWKTKQLLNGVVSGAASYGNAMGVPVVGGDTAFDSTYDGNILVNAFALGLVEKDAIFTGVAEGVGNPILYVGARTGRDGIRGATMASASFGEGSEELRPTVQVGDPFYEKLLLECCLELFKSGSVIGVQDMGAAGLLSSSSEMASRSGNGVRIDIEKVPRREEGMTPEEVLLSESQERMLFVCKSGREAEIIAVCEKWDLPVAVIGVVTDTGRYEIFENDVQVASIPGPALTEGAPKYDRPRSPPANLAEIQTPVPAPELADAGDAIIEMLSNPTIASKRWIYEQFDSRVRLGTVVGPGQAGSGVVRLPGSKKGVAMNAGSSQRFCYLSPRLGARLTVMAAARNLACVGAEPIGVTDCLNFGNPELPEVSWQLSECIDGIADACNALATPVVSGNVSLYNDTDGVSIDPTPMIGIVGLLDDASLTTDASFKKAGDVILLVGKNTGELGGSEFLASKGIRQGLPPSLDDALEIAVHNTVRTLVRGQIVASAHDVSEGGISVTLAESCLAGALGAKVRLESTLPVSALLFGEEPSRIVVSCRPENEAAVRRIAGEFGAPVSTLGTVGGDRLELEGIASLELSKMADVYESALPRLAGDID